MLGSSIKKLLATGVLLLFAAQANAAFNINLAFNSVADSYKTYFTVAENYWESVIAGYQGTPISRPKSSARTEISRRYRD